MNKIVLDALLEFLVWWSLITVGYAGAILTVDGLLAAWQKRRTARQGTRRQLEALDTDMRAAVGRLTTEFLAAQQAIRCVARQEAERR